MIQKAALPELATMPGLSTTADRSESGAGSTDVLKEHRISQNRVLGSAWGMLYLKTTVAVFNIGAYLGNQLVLEPNSDNSDAADGFRSHGAEGSKFMASNTLPETTSDSEASGAFPGPIGG